MVWTRPRARSWSRTPQYRVQTVPYMYIYIYITSIYICIYMLHTERQLQSMVCSTAASALSTSKFRGHQRVHPNSEVINVWHQREELAEWCA